MAEATKKSTSTPVVDVADNHDRVTMLSINKDGTPDQVAPEIIGDKATAVEATKRQFAENAVSAVDDANREAAAAAETVEQDPGIAEAKAEHEKVAKAAESKAESIVDDLHQG